MSNPVPDRIWLVVEPDGNTLWFRERSNAQHALAKMCDPGSAVVKYAPVPQWRPVSLPPEHGVRVLVWQPGRPLPYRAYYRHDLRCWQEQGFDSDPGDIHPTHWQPFPDPPEVTP